MTSCLWIYTYFFLMKVLSVWGVCLQTQCAGSKVCPCPLAPSPLRQDLGRMQGLNDPQVSQRLRPCLSRGEFCASQACAAALCLYSCCQLGLVLALSPVFQVEPEARRSGARSQLPTSIEIVSEGKGAWQRGTAEVCPLTHFFPHHLHPVLSWFSCHPR